eukprot:15449978-Alexandrium_andersonii.AAC.2
MARNRGNATSELGDALAEFVREPGAIKYGEKMDRSAVESELLVAHAAFLRALMPFGNITQKSMEVELLRLAEQRIKAKQWTLQQEHMKEFAEVTAKRIRTMVRHISSARTRPKPPKWVFDIFGEAVEVCLDMSCSKSASEVCECVMGTQPPLSK